MAWKSFSIIVICLHLLDIPSKGARELPVQNPMFFIMEVHSAIFLYHFDLERGGGHAPDQSERSKGAWFSGGSGQTTNGRAGPSLDRWDNTWLLPRFWFPSVWRTPWVLCLLWLGLAFTNLGAFQALLAASFWLLPGFLPYQRHFGRIMGVYLRSLFSTIT